MNLEILREAAFVMMTARSDKTDVLSVTENYSKYF